MWQKAITKYHDCNVRLREKSFLAYHKQKRLFLHLFSLTCLFSLTIGLLTFMKLLTIILVKHLHCKGFWKGF